MELNRIEKLIHKIREVWKDQRQKNEMAKRGMLSINMNRMLYMLCIAVLIHVVLILQFKFNFTSRSALEETWRKGILAIHSANLIIICTIAMVRVIFRGNLSVLGAKILHNLFLLDIAVGGIALVAVDQYVTTNITPFLTACVIIGVFLLNPPIISVSIYIVSYIAFHIMIGFFYGQQPTVLMSNRVNGFTFVCIGICISIIMWHSYRKSILQEETIKKQQKALESLAFYDSLTGLFNRRRWLSFLEDEMKRMKRFGHESSIVLIDVDYFKDINDKYGHPIGDKVLEEIAAVLKNEIRSVDRAARWGGEEFIVLFTDTTPEGAVKAAEKLREFVEKAKIKVQNNEINVTISLGVAGLGKAERPFEESYHKADESLYLAKQSGRNRVECIELFSQELEKNT